MFRRSILILGLTCVLGALAVFFPTPARAAGILYTVTSLDDSVANNGQCTLREAITASNGYAVPDCGPGSSDEDEIEFAVIGTVSLNSELPAINGALTIGGGSFINISGSQAYRILTVNGGKALTLKDINLIFANATTEGGAIRNFGTLYVTNSNFLNNHADPGGGAIYSFGIADISNSQFINNTGVSGGAIQNPGILNLNTVKFQENFGDSQSSGGAIWSSGPLTISASEFSKNRAGSGGAIYARRDVDATTLSITGSSFTENLTTGSYPNANGGALLADNLAVTIQASTFSNNGGQSGGAIHVMPQANLTLTNSTLRDNHQTTNGAGIYNKGTATLTNVTLSGNRASHGGGIDNFGALSLTNVTLSGNQADYGGGLKNEGGTATLINVTLASNSATNNAGGGILNTNPNTHLHLKNVLAANSPTGGNCTYGTAPDSSEFNLSSDNTCSFGAGRDNVNVLLGPLANNGGSTQTHLPQYTSPVIDKGTDSGAPGTDQRGGTRPQGAHFDVGAVEVACVKPVKPTLKSPKENKTLGTTSPVLKWNAANCATTYTLIVRDAVTGRKAFKQGGVPVLKYKTDPLPAARKYKWFVKACNKPFGCIKSAARFFTLP